MRHPSASRERQTLTMRRPTWFILGAYLFGRLMLSGLALALLGGLGLGIVFLSFLAPIFWAAIWGSVVVAIACFVILCGTVKYGGGYLGTSMEPAIYELELDMDSLDGRLASLIPGHEGYAEACGYERRIFGRGKLPRIAPPPPDYGGKPPGGRPRPFVALHSSTEIERSRVIKGTGPKEAPPDYGGKPPGGRPINRE